MASRATQTDRVIDYILRFGSINPMQALYDLSVMRLASRMSDIKKQGRYLVIKTMQHGVNRMGEPVRYASYSLIDTEGQHNE